MGNLIETETWPAGIPYFEADAILTGGPDCPDNVPIQALANRTAFLKKQIDDAVSGALTVMYTTRLKSARTISMSGDGTWSVAFDGNGNVTAAMTLANSGVAAGTYRSVTVDNKGRVIAAANPTTLAGYGITDALLASSYTAADVLTKLKTVDGAASGLDADLLDGQEGSYYLAWGNLTGKPNTLAGYGINNGVSSQMTSLMSFEMADSGFALVTIAAGNEAASPTGAAEQFLVITVGGAAITVAKAQYAIARSSGSFFVRFMNTDVTGWSGWRRIAVAADSLTGYGITLPTQAQAEAGTDNTLPMTPLRVVQAIAAKVAQATETVLGVAKIATQAQVDAGTDDAAFITAKKLRFGFAASFTANGYVAFPSWLGGFILQWGSHAATTSESETAVSFPVTFPVAVYGVVSTFGHNEASAQTSIVSQTRSITTTGFLSRREDIGTATGTLATGYIKWLAWGK